MKIRTGFVSNSSSSSFVIITSPQHYNKCLELFDENNRKVIEGIGYVEAKLFGLTIYAISGYSDRNDNSGIGNICSWDGDPFPELYDEENDEKYDWRETWWKFRKKLLEDKENCFIDSQDW